MTLDIQKIDAGSSSELDWNIDGIVAELRELRNESLAARRRIGKPVKLPSRTALTHIVEGLSAALFPNRLGSHAMANESVDYFVGHTLDKTLRELVGQILRDLLFVSGDDAASHEQHEHAIAIVRAFAGGLPEIRAVTHHRLAHALYRLEAPLVARIIAEIAHSTTGIDIHPGAQIKGSFFIDHGTGVVIGETAIIGERVRLYHGVTLGAKRFLADEDGTLIKGNARHPIVEDDVVIYAGATILGRITIGRGSVIGGNVWLTQSVPAGSNISQAKVRSEDFDGGSGI